MARSPFAFTAAERRAIEKILAAFPEAVAAIESGLRLAIDQLIESVRGLIASEAEADALLEELLAQVVDEAVTEADDWGEAEDVRRPSIELLTRHILAEARAEFLQQVLTAKRN